MVDKLVERLRLEAATASKIARQMAEDKSLRQGGNTEGRTDLYMWPTPEQTIEGQAADALAIAQNRVNELEAALKQIAGGEVGGDHDEPFSGYMRCRKIALDALALPTTLKGNGDG